MTKEMIDLDAVRKAVRDSGYRSDWLAERIGVDPSTVTRFMSGKTRLGKPALILLFQTLNVNAEAFRKKAS